MTLSFGAASLIPSGHVPAVEIIRTADEALYEAKRRTGTALLRKLNR